MTKGDLDGVTCFGRPIKPVALGACVLMATLTVFNIIDKGAFGAFFLGDVVAVLTGISLIGLLGGWFGRSQAMAEVGLLAGCVAYVMRGSFLLFYIGPTEQGVYLSTGAAIILGGAYLLELWDHNRWNSKEV